MNTAPGSPGRFERSPDGWPSREGPSTWHPVPTGEVLAELRTMFGDTARVLEDMVSAGRVVNTYRGRIRYVP